MSVVQVTSGQRRELNSFGHVRRIYIEIQAANVERSSLMHNRFISLIGLSVTVVLLQNTAFAQVTWYTDEDKWNAAAPNAQSFPLSAANLALSEELAKSPTDSADLDTKTLTFLSSNTPLSFDFMLQTIQFDENQRYNFLFNTFADTWPDIDHLDIGGKGNFDDDDLQISFFGCEQVFAVGFLLLGNGGNSPDGDTVSVYGRCGNLLGTLVLEPSGHTSVDFIGVVSSQPIGRLVLNEDSGTDDIFIGTLMFESSPPCPGDLDGDGNVGVKDLLELIGNWGPCVP